MSQIQGEPFFPHRLPERVMPWPRGAYLCLVAVASFGPDFAALGGDRAPPSPDKPWYPPQLREYETDLAHGDFAEKRNSVEIEPEKVYDLPELIDIAERTNPQTRIAWERAR